MKKEFLDWYLNTPKGVMTTCVAGVAAVVGIFMSPLNSINRSPWTPTQSDITQRLQTDIQFKQIFESNVHKCVELEVSPLVYLANRDNFSKPNAVQLAAKEAEPACRRDEFMRWQRVGSSYLVQKYG